MAETPNVSNGAQVSENVRKISFLNYKSAALNQLSYAGASHMKAAFSKSIKSSS
jgi:hypothetical protein